MSHAHSTSQRRRLIRGNKKIRDAPRCFVCGSRVRTNQQQFTWATISLERPKGATRVDTPYRKHSSFKLVPINAFKERVRHQGVGALATQALALLGLNVARDLRMIHNTRIQGVDIAVLARQARLVIGWSMQGLDAGTGDEDKYSPQASMMAMGPLNP